jgi:hypothetical protein
LAGKNRKILLVSYYFPPLGMGGVGRALGLYKYLPRFGFDVTVLTVKKVLYPEYDESLLQNLDSAGIIRTGSSDPARILYLLGVRKSQGESGTKKTISQKYFPDSKAGWKKFAFRKAGRLLRKKEFAAIITTSPPPSAHQIGLALKRKYRLPWVADFRDFWFSRPIEEVYSDAELIGKALKLKDEIIKLADAIVAVNDDIKKYLGRGDVISNGAEPEHIDIWRIAGAKSHQKFIIGILGTINYLCPVEPLFRALRHLENKSAARRKEISIIQVGHYDKSMMTGFLAKYNLSDKVELRGYLPRKEAIGALSGADLLYLGVGKFEKLNILPGRIFDYLISGKPILAIVPENSEAANLIREYGQGKVIAGDNVEEIVSYITGLADGSGADLISRPTNSAELHKYTTLALAEKYGALLTRILK